jgi:nucleoside-triphosphatase
MAAFLVMVLASITFRAAAAMSRALSTTDWILVTGQPGCGKTTAVTKMVKLLQAKGMDCRGFYTEEVRVGSNRIGFDVVTVSSQQPQEQRGILARSEGLPSSFPKTGKYRVDVASFEKLALPSLAVIPDDNNHKEKKKPIVYVLDEIGRMELHSKKFPDHVRQMLASGVRLVGAITAPRYGHRVPFCDEVAAMPGVQVHNLTKKTRDETTQQLLQYIQEKWILAEE